LEAIDTVEAIEAADAVAEAIEVIEAVAVSGTRQQLRSGPDGSRVQGKMTAAFRARQ
jgi:hypothetical protein